MKKLYLQMFILTYVIPIPILNLVSPDGFGSPVPRQPAHLHTQAEYGAYLRDSSRVPRWRPFIYYATNCLPYVILRSEHEISAVLTTDDSVPRAEPHRLELAHVGKLLKNRPRIYLPLKPDGCILTNILVSTL